MSGRWFKREIRRVLHRRHVLTVAVRWRFLRWLDRPLARLLRLKPRMLSSRVSIERVPFTGTRAERVKLWLWEHHSVRAGIWVAVILGIGLCMVSLGVATVFDVPIFRLQDGTDGIPGILIAATGYGDALLFGPQATVDGIPTILVATAGYGGALFGFLQAVAIFAVQLRSQQDTSMLPLTPLIARRYFTFLVLGSVAGVTIANLIAVFSIPVLPVEMRAFTTLTWINLFAVPGMTLAALWYLTKIVSEAGESDMDIALPVLRATMRAQSLADARAMALLNEYVEALEAANISYSPFSESSLTSRPESTVRIPFGKAGVIRNVDCIRLARIGELLACMDQPPKGAVTVTYDQAISLNDALVLKWDDDVTGREAFDERLQNKIASLLKASFLVKKGNTE